MLTRAFLYPFFGFITALSAQDTATDAKRQALDELILSPEIWEKSLTEIKKMYEPDDQARLRKDQISKELIEKIANGQRVKFNGVLFGGDPAFEWLSSAKNGLRSPGGDFTLFEKNVGEVVIRAEDKKAASISISIFNRGDDKRISRKTYEERLVEWKGLLDQALAVRSETRDKSGVVKTTGWMWRKGKMAYLLEGSLLKKENRAEFIRLRLANVESTRRKTKTASRRSLSDNVETADNGDVYVGGLPMVDQGQKGYCVVASVERVARYYGLDVDQHELAQLANSTSSGGTRGDDMEKAFKKITGKIHVKTLGLMDYEWKQFERDVKTYNREAKRTGGKVFPKNYNSAQGFWMQLDKEAFKTVKAKQPKYDGFRKNIKKWVDQGVPLCWTLHLGMFPEREGSQQWGGHMRIIHGYNEDTEELLYTDSWGEGHEMKRMPFIHGWCMTTGLYAMVPTN